MIFLRKKQFSFLVFCLSLFACDLRSDASVNQNLALKELHPFRHEFMGGLEKTNLDEIRYYYLEGEYKINEDFKKKIKTIALAKIGVIDKKYEFSSIQIYQKNKTINENFRSNKDISSSHNKYLVAFIRFNRAKMDIFYLLEDGNVIFDLVENRSEDFEFGQ
jgi:hypothetical protein